MKILLLSAYDAVSHQYWREGLVNALPDYQWTVLTLPARFFAWRVRGNSLSWALSEREKLIQPYDLIICTSMTDLSALKGLVPELASTPCLVYFHENQFAYPQSGREFNPVEPQMLSIYTALAANKVVFNTEFNRQTFLCGARSLLKKLPDNVPRGIVESIEDRSSRLYVPLPDIATLPDKASSYERDTAQPLSIVWNHRWEFDKGPNLLKAIISHLLARNLPAKLHIVGQRFRYTAEIFDEIRELLEENKANSDVSLSTWGYIEDKGKYQTLLNSADIVLSTAKHDFQGISVMEAVQRGCIPLVPNQLAYPEIFDKRFCYSVAGSDNETAKNVLALIEQYYLEKKVGRLTKAPTLASFQWQVLKPDYRKLIEQVAGRNG